jgi:hypothetical protein
VKEYTHTQTIERKREKTKGDERWAGPASKRPRKRRERKKKKEKKR